MTNLMQTMAPTPPAVPGPHAPGREAGRTTDRMSTDRTSTDHATTDRTGERGADDRSSTERAGGERDFLTMLTALLPGADQGTDEPQDAQGAIADALTELARLGEGGGEGEADISWPIPALLARFIEPDAPTDGSLTLGEAVAAIDEALTAEGAQALAAATAKGETAEAEASTMGSATPAPAAANAEDAQPAGAGRPGALVDAAPTDGDAAAADVTTGQAQGSGQGAEDPDAHGRATAAAARAETAARNEAMSAAAAARPTGSADEAPDASVAATSASTSTSTGTTDGLDGIDGLRIATAPSTTAAEQEVARASSARSFASSAASVQRVLDAVELLENAPPPRQLTLELGENRLRVSVEDGQVRLSLLGQDDADATRLLEEARAALEERGFDLGGDRRGDGTAQDGQDGRDPGAGGPVPGRSSSRPATAGLRL